MFKHRFFENNSAFLRNLFSRKKSPVYIQYYVTAKCNLKCQQCNIIYSNPGHKEMDMVQVEKTAANLKKLGAAIVLLTGGEPFVHKELPAIVKIFTKQNIHVRIQTNGYTSFEKLKKCADHGARDISISLDSLNPAKQEFINGEKKDSWRAAIEAVAYVTQIFPKKNSFASFGAVLTPFNWQDIEDVLEFAKRISWQVSLVPIHVMKPHQDAAYERRLFAQEHRKELLFSDDQRNSIEDVVSKLKQMKAKGYPLYDSDIFLEDICRFVQGKELMWRSRNHNICDAPYLYFAIRPNGDVAPCCEYNVKEPISSYHPDFPKMFKDPQAMRSYENIAKACSGCMYGSYPEITIAIRFLHVALERSRLFMKALRPKNWPFSYDQLIQTAHNIVRDREALLVSVK